MGLSDGNVVEASVEGVVQAAAVLSRHGLVAFPTETVYGLGAVAFYPDAVERIYQVKGRPADNPLILHVSTNEMLLSVASEIPASALRLMDAFWPGPLTLVLKRAHSLPGIVSAGLDTVAVRVPSHPVALSLIDAVGYPIAAPSANRSGRPSPTLARHVWEDLGDSVDLILDGGPAHVGVESTVLDVTGPRAVLLRPGGVSREDIEAELEEPVEVTAGAMMARSPGTRYRHYAPRCRVELVPMSELHSVLTRHDQSQVLGLLCHSSVPINGTPFRFVRRVEGTVSDYARVLFASLLEAEAAGVDVLYVEEIDERGLGLAVMDRLRRASERSTGPAD